MIRKVVNLVTGFLGNRSSAACEFRSGKTPALLSHLARDPDNWHLNDLKLKDSEIGREILSCKPEEQKEIVLDLVDWLTRHEIDLQKKRQQRGYINHEYSAARMRNSLVELLRKKLPIAEEELLQLFSWSMIYESNYWRAVPHVIKQIQDFQKNQELTPRLRRMLASYIDLVSSSQYDDADTRQQVARLRNLAGHVTRNPLVPGEAWTDFALSQLAKFNESKRQPGSIFLIYVSLQTVRFPPLNGIRPAMPRLRQLDGRISNLPY